MKLCFDKLFCMLLTAFLFYGCVHEPPLADPEIPGVKPVGYISETTDQQGGQIPEDIARNASRMHGGSMISAEPDEPHSSGNGESLPMTAAAVTMILGPVNAERITSDQDVSSDAGQSIRETISQILTSSSDITLFDAPEERFIDDSPRPDLSRKGVKFVIKGVASTSSESAETTVFLRAVDTMTGKVSMVASARDQSRNNAASQAAKRLLKKITGEK